MKKYACIVAIVVSLFANCSHAEMVLGVTVFRELIAFDSAAPGTILSTQPITGLTGQDQFESVQAIDFRPATGQLYAIGNAPGSIYRIYTINPATASATQVGVDINLSGVTFLGFDFNPVADRLRIATDNDLNLRINPDTGAIAANDALLNYAAGDVNAGANPTITGAAYSNNTANALTTVLYDIDSSLNSLVTQNPPNNGTLNTIGLLGSDFSTTVGFDISGVSGTAFASSADQVNGATSFFTVNLNTGSATLVGQVGSGLIVNDIAASVMAVPEPTTFSLLSFTTLILAIARRKSSKQV
jgi:Domain of unknown function (DUF4394)